MNEKVGGTTGLQDGGQKKPSFDSVTCCVASLWRINSLPSDK